MISPHGFFADFRITLCSFCCCREASAQAAGSETYGQALDENVAAEQCTVGTVLDPLDGGRRSWESGDPVERLLDDISDIWVGAVVVGMCDANHYEIRYADDGSAEKCVEGTELRPRQVRCDMPAEVWESVGSCLGECHELCRFEQIVMASGAAMRRKSNVWWCTAFHERFGRCSGRCRFERIAGKEGVRLRAEASKSCYAASALGRTPADVTPWKARYIEQERLNDPARRTTENMNKQTPGDAAYSLSGKKAGDDQDTMKGWFYDPRFGKMVREC